MMGWRMMAAQHAAERAAAAVDEEMRRGLGGLATIAATILNVTEWHP